MADLLLRIQSTYEDNASRGLLNMLNPINFIMGAFKNIGNGVGNLAFGLKNLGTAGTVGMDAIKQGAGQALLGIGALAIALAAIAVIAGVALGVVAVKAAAEFQQEMLKVYALTGMSKAEFDQMNQSLLAMAPAVGVGPTELAKALYYVESDGFKGAAALKLVELSAIGAKVGLTDTMTVAFALTSAIRAFGFADSQATHVMDIMNNTVKQGKMEWGAYAVQVGRLSTAAKTSGVGFTEANAALSTLTQSGSSAAKGTTFLINLFNQMSLKTDAMAKHAKAAGITFDEVKFKSMSLGEKIAYLTHVTGGNATKMMQLMGNNSIAVRGYELLKDHAGAYATILNNLNHSSEKGNNLQAAWNITQQGFNVTMDKAKATFQVLLITIGNALLPTITRIVAAISPVLTAFGQWIVKSHAVENVISFLGTMFSTVGAVMGPFIGLLAAMGAQFMRLVTWIQHNETALLAIKIVAIALGAIIAIALILMIAAFIILLIAVAVVIGIVIGIIMLIITVVKNWGNIGHWFMGIWAAIGAWLVSAWGAIGAFFVGLWNGIKSHAIAAWNGLVNGIKGILGAIGAWFANLWNGIKNTAVNIWNATVNGIKNVVNTVVNWLKSVWQNVVNAIVGFFNWLYNHNYYWKMMVDTIKAYVQAAIVWLQATWKNIVSWIVNTWQDIVRGAQLRWHQISQAITDAVNTVVNWLKNTWNTIVTWIGARWHDMVGLAQTAWDAVKGVFNAVWGWMVGIFNTIWSNISSWFSTTATNMQTKSTQAWTNVSTVFSNAWGTYISGPLTTLGTSIGTFFSNLAATAISWGQGIINGIINGINNMLGALGSAAANAAGTIAKFLGFHSSEIGPTKEGPGRYLAEWGKGIANGLANGMLQNQRQVANAAVLLLHPFSGTNGSAPPVNRGSTASGGGVTVIIEHIHVNDFGPNMPNSVANTIVQKLDQKLGMRFKLQYNGSQTGVS